MRSVLPLLALCCGALIACTHPSPNFEVEFISTPSPSPVFSPAVRIGNLLFLSGQIGTDASNKLVPGGLQAEARQALNNIKRVLEQNGSSLDRVVKCTVFLADMREWQDFNDIYVTYFRVRKPARSAMGATGLALGARVEIECIGVTG
jgi:2-iminobutanoate/2-iminopropanoate deaminase